MSTNDLGHDGLILSSVSLHIDNVVPRDSISSIEAKKAVTEALSSSKDQPTHDNVPHRPGLSAQDSWAQLQIKDRMQWMEHFKQNKRGGLVFQDREALKKQQGVFKEVMMQVGSQLLSGKLAVRISLPIRIFEPQSLLERVADGWNYAPTVLKKAALSGADPIERMKFVMAFVAGGLHFCVGQLKPFNPILGETYEATYADGTQVFMEHVSHHPVKSAFTVVGPKGLYRMSGVYEFESVSTRNSLANYQNGTVAITFHDGVVITYTMPQIKMSGILFGDRVVEIVGSSRFEDAANRLGGELNFDANSSFLKKSQSDDIKGCIYPAKVRKSAKHAVATVNGSWLSHLQFDGKTYWHVESEPAFEHTPVDNPLPSDVRYREDIIALKNGDEVLAQSEKLRLEAVQRADLKLREEKVTRAKA
ncbi:oxysterol binding family protein [Phytophthora cinnamomi]|uniref:oxysterol binding family protein n=1 Tax=Phytophthora cinnamomi TaxID=4785 RepID=UPI00355A23FF|nr:oxysterol binding family protein [Phytophthora cinnamomi]